MTICSQDDPNEWRVRLDLRKHCIETAVKRLHEQRMQAYFKQPRRRHVIEQELLGLERALHALDFGRLRTQYHALAGGTEAEVFLSLPIDRRPEIFIDGMRVNDQNVYLRSAFTPPD